MLGLQQVLKGLGDFSGQKKDQFINIEVGNGDVIDLVIVHLIGDPLDAGQKLMFFRYTQGYVYSKSVAQL